LKEGFEFKLPSGGLAFWLVPKKQSAVALYQQLKKQHIGILNPEKYSFNAPINGLRIGYASASEEDATKLINALKSII